MKISRFVLLRRVGSSSLMLLLFAAAVSAQSTVPPQLRVGSKAPIMNVTDLDGKLVRVGPVLGKKGAVIEFWATWCELCEELLPRMAAAKSRYGNQFDFFGINVTVSDAKPRVRRYLAEHNPPFATLYDESGAAVRAFNALATSHVVIVDQTGVVRYIGDGGKQDIQAALAKLVKP